MSRNLTADLAADLRTRIVDGVIQPRMNSVARARPRAILAMVQAMGKAISSVSAVSFQDAIVKGVERANKTLKNVKGAWVKDQEVTIDNGKVTGYKVILKVTFILTE